MRSFAYKNENFEKDAYVPELVENNPCYQQSVYDSVMYDETPDGDLIQAEYGADLARKQGRTHYWESVARGVGSIASGAGNVIGAFRPGANIYRNDYGSRNGR